MAEKKNDSKKPATKKKAAPAKKSPAKKSPAKKSPVKKSPVKKTTAKKSPVKKSPVKKSPAKKSPVKKTTAKPVVVKNEGKVENLRDVTTSKPLNVIQPNIDKKVVDNFKGTKAADSKSAKPNLFIRIITLNFFFGWW